MAPDRAFAWPELAPGHAQLIFRWSYRDRLFSANGEGVARVAPPDSVRLDFFVDGGVGGGAVVLIGDSLRAPPEASGLRYLPPVPLLWAALGVARLPGADTVVRVIADTIFVEVGQRWRLSAHDGALQSLARIEGDRLRELVQRVGTTISYNSYAARRRLTLSDLRRVTDVSFDSSIWRF